jgi:hypothetical protein
MKQETAKGAGAFPKLNRSSYKTLPIVAAEQIN